MALFAGSVATIPMIPTSFLSEGGQKLIAITVSPPPGADVQAVEQVRCVWLYDICEVRVVVRAAFVCRYDRSVSNEWVF